MHTDRVTARRWRNFQFSGCFLFSGMNSAKGRSHRVFRVRRDGAENIRRGGGVSFSTSRRKIGSFASLMARRVISLFASLRNSFAERSNWGESRIPFQRISNYRGWSRVQARAFKPVLRRELLIRFSQPDRITPGRIKFTNPRNTIRTSRYTPPYNIVPITDLLNVLRYRRLLVLILQSCCRIITFILLNN